MKGKKAYIVGTFDTKEEELIFVKSQISKYGINTITVDIGTSSRKENPSVDITANMIAEYHPDGIDAVFTGDRGSSVAAMADAFQIFLNTKNDISGVIGLGGSGGTALISPAFQSLKLGLPKVIVSTMASGNIAPYIGTSDISMIYSITDIGGLNPILEKVLSNAANALCGMIKNEFTPKHSSKPLLGMTMFGVTTKCVEDVKQILEDQHQCLIFHATGTGGKTLEKLVENNELSGVLDITTTEIADHLMGGILSAGEKRLNVFANANIPYIGSCGAIDMVNFGAIDSIPEKYKNRHFYKHNPQITLMRTSAEENARIGKWIGKKLNQFNTTTAFMIPLKGFSALDIKGGDFFDPEADNAFIQALEETVTNEKIKIIKLPYHINDTEFSDAIIKQYFKLKEEIKR